MLEEVPRELEALLLRKLSRLNKQAKWPGQPMQSGNQYCQNQAIAYKTKKEQAQSMTHLSKKLKTSAVCASEMLTDGGFEEDIINIISKA